MRTELLDGMADVGMAFDTETWLIQPRNVAPPLVCGSVACADGSRILDAKDTRWLFERLLSAEHHPGCVIIGANIVYDLAVMAIDAERRGISMIPAILDKIERGEIYDIQIAEMLDAIGLGCLGKDPRTGKPITNRKTGKKGGYSLDFVTELCTGRTDAKENDLWRLRYAFLQDVPLAQWPPEARQYPIDDANNTRVCALIQCGLLPRPDGQCRRSYNLHAMTDAVKTAFALQLGAVWGFATDQDAVDVLEAATQKIFDEGCRALEAAGVYRWDPKEDKYKKVTNVVKKMVASSYGATDPCHECAPHRAKYTAELEAILAGQQKATATYKGYMEEASKGGKVPGKGRKPINCKTCGGTGLYIHGGTVPLTDGGESGIRDVSTGRVVLADSGHETLEALADMGEQVGKTLTQHVPALREGLPMRPNVPLANERVSYRGTIQVMPRGGMVRQCVVARDGRVLSSVDGASLEMVTWAQTCINLGLGSKLAEALNSDPPMDPHSMLGSTMSGRAYEEFLALKDAGDKKIINLRQAAKAGNFTFAGLGGIGAFVLAKRNEPGMSTTAPNGKVYKGTRFCILIGGAERCGAEMVYELYGRPTPAPLCKACLVQADKIKKGWLRTWPEASRYKQAITDVIDNRGYIEHFVSGVLRGDVTFTSAANGYFSALAAVGMRRALWAVTVECFTDRSSPLWMSRPIAFIHDEIVTSHPESVAHEAAVRVGEIVVCEMQKCTPDVRVRAEPALMRRLYKGAEPVFENGRLVPWEPA